MHELATGLKVNGRSKMNKDQLVTALKAKKAGSPKRRKPTLYNKFIAEEVPKIMKAKGCVVQEAFKLAAAKWKKVLLLLQRRK